MARRRKDKGARKKRRGASSSRAVETSQTSRTASSNASSNASSTPERAAKSRGASGGDARTSAASGDAPPPDGSTAEGRAPTRRPGLGTRIGIVLFLLIQMLLPLRYYTISDNPYDERFAWRMFSPIRMLSCDPQFRLDGERLQLETEFHTAWITLLKRGRPAVVEEAGRHLCERYPEREVTFYYRCRELNGEIQVLNDGTESICEGRP